MRLPDVVSKTSGHRTADDSEASRATSVTSLTMSPR
jgi:hypothetical protein